MSFEHIPVMLTPCLEGLKLKANGLYIDGTFGRGGHSAAILKQLGPEGRLIATDKDMEAVHHARTLFNEEPRFSIYHQSFGDLGDLIKAENLAGKVDGILLDLGVSSPQLDDATRGFSFIKPGPLDMRMNQSAGLSAKEWLATVKESELADVLYHFGEERYSRRIARAIIKARDEATIETTEALAEIVKVANPKWEKHKHPATRAFQAIRIYINNELADLEKILDDFIDLLAISGRMVVLSFHSLEDRLVKRQFRALAKGKSVPRHVPIVDDELDKRLKLVTKATKATSKELDENVRARSAVLRVGEKIA